MASQLVKNKWQTGEHFPDFYETLEHVSEKIPVPKQPIFKHCINPIGIEVEVEGWILPPVQSELWEIREDGSLKDHGREFVSRILSGVLIDYALEELELIFRAHNQHAPLKWTHRTSIHVHANISDLPAIKLKWLIAYYALTEPLWYQYCDEKRIGNSFCFPICSMNPRTITPGRNWPKYCGFNLGSSLLQFNTVEFRQMHGHADFKLYRTWIKRICEFVNYIYHTPAKTLRLQMDKYLDTGKITFKEAFGGSLPKDVDQQIYDNAKWVADFIYKGTK